MDKTYKPILCAALFAVMAASCQKVPDVVEPEYEVKETIEISINGLMGEYTQSDAVKASLVNTIRVSWEGGEKVFVFDGTRCLGSLSASLDGDGDDRYALLSTDEDHIVEAPAQGTTKLTLVYSPLLGESENPAVIDGAVSISLADQDGAKAPFVAYATLDYNGGESITGAVVPFKFATSVIKVNCIGLNAGTAIDNATLSNVNTACKLTLSATAAPTVEGDVNGTITRTGDSYFSASKVNSEGEAVFQIAVPVLSSGTRELALVQSTGKRMDQNFSKTALPAATSVNTVCQLVAWKGTVTFDVQGKGKAPASLTNLEYGSLISAPASPPDDYFICGGWYKEAACINAWDFATDEVTENITLYAKWDLKMHPAGTLPGKFTVDSTGRKVFFSRGNLWHDNTVNTDMTQRFYFYLEDSQWHSLPSRDSMWRIYHVNHFHWSHVWDCVVAKQFKYNKPRLCDTSFFTNATENTPTSDVSFTVVVDGLKQNGIWRILSDTEWDYLLEKRHMTYGKPRYTNRTDTVYVRGGSIASNLYKGIFIYPDDYNGAEVQKYSDLTWSQIDSAGIVFLLAGGVRQLDSVMGVGVTSYSHDSHYWTSKAHESDTTLAYALRISREGVSIEAEKRDVAHAVRLVRDCPPEPEPSKNNLSLRGPALTNYGKGPHTDGGEIEEDKP